MYTGIKNNTTIPLPKMRIVFPIALLLVLISSLLVFVIHSWIFCGSMLKYSDALVMSWLSIIVNLLTNIGHDSLNRIACENKKPQNAAMTKKVRNKVIIMATNRLIFIRTRKFTTGFSKIAIMTAKTTGTIMPWAIYKIANRADRPTKKMLAFA